MFSDPVNDAIGLDRLDPVNTIGLDTLDPVNKQNF